MENFNALESGRRLRELRGDRPQIEVARALNVTAMTISSYERGERIPPDPMKCALANYYGKSVTDIFFNAE